jgi:dTDP-4-amino-4,6-dideoxygalactose transaminase
MSITTEAAVVSPVPMSGPDITASEIASVTEVLASGCLSIGPMLSAFERRIEALTGARHAAGVSSGTAGLHLAVIAAGVGERDLVITTPFSFVASANCILYERAIPVFVDVDPVTGNIDTALVREAVRDIQAGGAARQRWLPRTATATGDLKAILPVHAFGQPADMDPILEAASSAGAVVIEDACEAVGSEYKHRPCGGIGDVGVFAFYPNKQATTGEGGMLVTSRDDFAALFLSLRNQGRDAMSAWLEHDRLGYNYRMDELSAALGVAQFARLEELLVRRERVAQWYSERLGSVPGITLPFVDPMVTRMSWFAYVIRIEPEISRVQLMTDLAARGVPTRPYFTPIHLQPFYAERFAYRRGDYPVTEALGDTSLALPFSGTMTSSDVDRVCTELRSAVHRNDRRLRARVYRA